MKTFKILIIFAIFISFTSCDLDKRQTRLNELEVKNAELDYLTRLYQLKTSIKQKEQIRVLDSLINSIE
tara:strand:- start:50 stop:256 length:207 start_codon:yes stop_codon:yes gene_type:complete